ncbi:MAG: DNA polymerase [Candidatus Dojkabacteria bacterium]|nr:MAG: DNA polymerase [Candidatus Dojkabacteria bacterium]
MNCKSRVDLLQKTVFEAVGHEFNLNSPKQLGEVLFDELHLPGGGRAKSTREEVLLTLKEMHPAIESILQYREAAKVLGTYVNPFEEIMKSAEDGRIHTDFVQTGASSGRFSSLNPNLQNIPARGDLAEKVRKFFIPGDGFCLASFDYSQIEYRIVADASNDPVLIKYFDEGLDIHRNTASKLFKVSAEEVTSKQRNVGKTVNFGILYGQSKFGLSRMLGISPEEADLYIKTYYQTYAGVAEYMNRAVQEAQSRGYVESMFGRRRYMSGLNSANSRIMNAAVREAINMPMQGSAADIMKLAMVGIQREIDKEWGEKVFLLLQIHDEFVLEIEKGVVEEVAKKIEEIMENCVKMSLPLKVGWGYGDNWAEIKE